MMITIRPASAGDLATICDFDHLGQDTERKSYLQHSIQQEQCHVAVINNAILGYVILEYTFFGLGFVSLLYTHPEHRRGGIGTRLMQHAEDICTTEKLFTSTNLSNHSMQNLLARRQYKLSGVIHDLDEGDPELFYVKFLRQ
jgi:ribosomal protein S18 acetylase RimI-like enzyme